MHPNGGVTIPMGDVHDWVNASIMGKLPSGYLIAYRGRRWNSWLANQSTVGWGHALGMRSKKVGMKPYSCGLCARESVSATTLSAVGM